MTAPGEPFASFDPIADEETMPLNDIHHATVIHGAL